MNNVDENTKVAIEIMQQGAKISEELILKIMKKITNLLSKDNKEKYILKDTSKEGKQKINDLIKKHKDGVLALDENITKQQLNDYKEELKKLGVDFSVVKNEKDSYSFFFASQQASVIEKALKNIVERKNNVLENEQVKKLEKELKNAKQDLPKNKELEVKKLYDEISTSKDKKPKENNITYDRLSQKEKLLYAKLEELDGIKRSLYSQEVQRVENLFENRYKNDLNFEKGIEDKVTEKDMKAIEKPLEKVRSIVSNLDEKEQSLLYNKVGLVAEKVSENDFKEMQKHFTPGQIEKIESIVSDNVSADVKQGNIVDNKLNANVFGALLEKVKKESTKENEVRKENIQEENTENSHKEEQVEGKGESTKTSDKENVKAATKENKVEFSMNSVKVIDTKIKEEQKVSKDKHKQQSISR